MASLQEALAESLLGTWQLSSCVEEDAVYLTWMDDASDVELAMSFDLLCLDITLWMWGKDRKTNWKMSELTCVVSRNILSWAAHRAVEQLEYQSKMTLTEDTSEQCFRKLNWNLPHLFKIRFVLIQSSHFRPSLYFI